MHAAIDAVRANLEKNVGGPFGACIVRDDEILSVAHNSVLHDHDPTCHAEINAIRATAKKIGSHDLANCVIYSTTEPCPMCFSAIHWANIEKIVFGTRIEDVQKLGFREMSISNEQMKTLGNSPVILVPDFEKPSCQQLLQDWQKESDHLTY